MNTIVITEKNDVVRTGLKAALEGKGIAEVIGDYSGEDEMMRDLGGLQPDVVILGGNRSLWDRCRACQDVREVSESTRILTLTEQHRDDELRELILAGASGCVVKDAGSAEIIRSVVIVANGGLSFDEDAVSRLMGRVPEQPDADAALTERQTLVLALIAKGCKNGEIAQELTISNSTVKSDIAKIKGKLSLDTRSELAAYAAQHGIFLMPNMSKRT